MRYSKNAGEMVKIPPKPIENLKIREDVKSLIRSCILSRKGGIPGSELREEYKKLVGEDIPYAKAGYHSIFHLIHDMPEIMNRKNENGEHVMVVKPNKKTEHLHKLIAKQKDPKVYTQSKDSRRRDRSFREKKFRSRLFDRARDLSRRDGPSQQPPVHELTERPKILTTPNVDNKPILFEPMIGTTQLVGDDFFLQLCIKYQKGLLERRDAKSAITAGTVQSGQTIRRAIARLGKINVLSNRLAINLGAVDIYNRRSSEEMVADYKSLLNMLKGKFGLSPERIVLCTIPPLGNVNCTVHLTQYVNLSAFNNWLREFAKSENYVLLDFFENFTTDNMVIDYDLFQQDARMVSGTPQPHVLWNYFGRQKAMRLLLNV